ncbi:hypothetical protein ACFQYP_35295 [Nonomuraea antimicrobica]
MRPRGWLEIRYLDAQHPAAWPVCVAVTHALVTDDRAGDAAMAAVEPYLPHGQPGGGPGGGRGRRVNGSPDPWETAARCGLAEPRLREAAETCFRAALEALPRLGAEPGLVGQVAAFADRHVSTGRSPAADLIDQMDLTDLTDLTDLMDLMDSTPGHPTPAWLDEGLQ